MKHLPTQLILMAFLLVVPATTQAQYGDAATPASITYEWVGTPRAPADSVAIAITTFDTKRRQTQIPLLLLADPQKISVIPVYEQLDIAQGPVGQSITVDYAGVTYDYQFYKSSGGGWNIEVSIIRDRTATTFQYKKLRLAQHVGTEHPLYKAYMYLLWDATHMPKPVSAAFRT